MTTEEAQPEAPAREPAGGPAGEVERLGGVRERQVQAILREFQSLFHLLAQTHAPEFLEIGITMSQAKALYLVAAVGPVHMSDLAARLGLSLSTVSGHVDRLVDASLVERREDPADRRQTYVGPTDLGIEVVERFHELNAAHLRRLLDHLDAPELIVVQQALHALARAAAASAPTVSAIPSPTPTQQESSAS